MSNDEIRAIIERIRGTFPRATDFQIQLLNDDFANVPRDVIERAVTRHGEVDAEFSIPKLKALIREYLPQTSPTTVYKGWRDSAESGRRSVDARLDPLSDAQLNARKAAVIENASPDARPFLEKCDTHKSPTLRACMANLT